MRLSDLEKFEKIMIQCHDNPDADALASGYGLFCYFKAKGKDVRLVYSGRNKITKSNLRLMVEKLEIPVEYLPVDTDEKLYLPGLLVTVDCQYGSGNVTGITADEIAVIDHHQLDREAIPLCVIQSGLGSCATLVWKLLKEENYDVDSNENLSTALFYGLYTDTNQFSELYSPLDMDMREALKVDKSLITLFRNSNLSLKELEIAGIAMIRYSYNDDYEFAVIKAQPCDPNILGLISDFLLQVDAIKTCVVFNETGDGYKFSVRSCIKEVNASEMASFLAEGMGTGGGHYEKAGGFISRKLYEKKYPTLHTEGYFNNRMTEYFDSFELIYAKDYEIDLSTLKKYSRKKIPLGYVKADDVMPVGTPATIRTLEGDMDMVVEEDLYIMIGIRGDIYLKTREEFQKSYAFVDDNCTYKDCIGREEYEPVMKNRISGEDKCLTDYARGCVRSEEVHVYARPLEKGVKVFTEWDKNKYLLGRPGDYLAVACDDLHDIFVVEKELFERSYDLIEMGNGQGMGR